jgi:hypothetical protein
VGIDRRSGVHRFRGKISIDDRDGWWTLLRGGGCGDRPKRQIMPSSCYKDIPSTGAENRTKTRATIAQVNILLVLVILQDIVTWAVKGQGGI